mgnify:FL=1
MWKYIATPVIVAIIGYVTNWIAVKMLFRPRQEIRIFGKRLPFTPGVIPRGQGRLARAVGEVVETQLLTPEFMGEKLLSKESEEEFKCHVQDWVNAQKNSEESLRLTVTNIVTEEKVDDFIASVEEDLTDFLSEKVIEMEPGKLIVDKVMKEAQSRLAESMFGMMLGGSFLEKIGTQVQEGIDSYIAENARGYIEKEVMAESLKLQEKPMSEVADILEQKGIYDPEFLWGLYKRIIEEKLGKLLSSLKLSAVVEERINAMKVEEVEELVLSIMNKELGAIVNLGAVIGLILGLINVVIFMI